MLAFRFEPEELTCASILNSACSDSSIAIGINIYGVPGPGECPGRGVNHLSLWNRSCGNCSNELSISELGPDQHTKGFFRYSEFGALRSYSQARIKLPIDNEQTVRIVGTSHHDIQLVEISDLCISRVEADGIVLRTKTGIYKIYFVASQRHPGPFSFQSNDANRSSAQAYADQGRGKTG